MTIGAHSYRLPRGLRRVERGKERKKKTMAGYAGTAPERFNCCRAGSGCSRRKKGVTGGRKGESGGAEGRASRHRELFLGPRISNERSKIGRWNWDRGGKKMIFAILLLGVWGKNGFRKGTRKKKNSSGRPVLRITAYLGVENIRGSLRLRGEETRHATKKTFRRDCREKTQFRGGGRKGKRGEKKMTPNEDSTIGQLRERNLTHRRWGKQSSKIKK